MASAGAAVAAVLLLLGAVGLVAPAPAAEDPEAAAGPPGAAEGAPAHGPPPVDNMEAPCLRAGGLCLLESECPPGQLSAQRGLCPAQRERGVECCHGLSIKERRCSARGGVCAAKHSCGVTDNRAEDCPTDEVCCPLLT